MITIAIVGIAAGLLAIQFKGVKAEYGIYISIAACIFIFFYIITKLENLINLINSIVEATSINMSYIQLMIKIIGITYIAEFSSDVCKDCGYSTVANQIQIFGKLTVLTLSIPIMEVLIGSIGEML